MVCAVSAISPSVVTNGGQICHLPKYRIDDLGP
jgi:hypothetical protein